VSGFALRAVAVSRPVRLTRLLGEMTAKEAHDDGADWHGSGRRAHGAHDAGPGARTIAIGTGCSPAAIRTATGFASRWKAAGGTVLCHITWPESAASWLRQATRFAAADPDLWIMAGPTTGWAQMTRRLLWSTSWQPGRTIACAALGTGHAIGLVGAHNLPGLAGATADGGTWQVGYDVP
jgi:hypothetical protein